jgi:formamidopyrimidine-DNA glycosylase
MPELPDLEVFARNLQHRLKRKKLLAVRLSKDAASKTSQQALDNAIAGASVSGVYREGKELRFRFSNKNILGVHLMLRGKFFWFEDKNTHGHSLLELQFGKDNNLVLTDYQHRATVTLNPAESNVPDALSKEVNEKFIVSILESRAAVKNILLDQHIIRGIGNAYADEILWDAGISPFSAANKIPPAGAKALAKSIKKVLTNAIKQVDKAEKGIIGGEIRDFLQVHNAAKKKSPTGEAIIKKIAGGRPTYYTTGQELYK